MRARIVAILGVTALFSLGCAQPKPASGALPVKAPGVYTEKLTVNGIERSFILRVPRAYNATARLPLVVLLHGWMGNATGIQQYTKFAEKAEQEGFFLAVPQGLGQQPGWNVDYLDLSGKKQDEIKFIGEVLDETEKEVGVDLQRIYVAGHSNGAMLAHLVGSRLSDRVAAIGAVAGTTGVPAAGGASLRRIPEPKTEVSVMIIHGKQDPLVAYGPASQALLKGIGVVESARWWAQKLGAQSTALIESKENGKVTIERYVSGRNGTEVVVVSLADAKHEWPGQTGGNIVPTVNATDMLWEFFKSHPKAP